MLLWFQLWGLLLYVRLQHRKKGASEVGSSEKVHEQMDVPRKFLTPFIQELLHNNGLGKAQVPVMSKRWFNMNSTPPSDPCHTLTEVFESSVKRVRWDVQQLQYIRKDNLI